MNGKVSRKSWFAYLSELSVFPALAAMSVGVWYYKDRVPVLRTVDYHEVGFEIVNFSGLVSSIQPWLARDLHRLLDDKDDERTGWLPFFVFCWGTQISVWKFIGSKGYSLVWSGMAGYNLTELLMESDEIAKDEETLNYVMSLVSAAVANAFYAITLLPHSLVPHLTGTLGGSVIYFLLNNRFTRSYKSGQAQ